jgi:hypothetical protein
MCMGCLLSSAACTDIFHATDFRTLCENDPANDACGSRDAGPAIDSETVPEAQAEAGPSLCLTDPAEARRLADRICGTESACGLTAGPDGVGECIFQALRAYDCKADEAQRPEGKRAQLFACRRQAKTCADFARCAGVTRACGAVSGSSCEGQSAVFCSGSIRTVTLCSATGRQCLTRGSAAPVCAGQTSATCPTDGDGGAACSGSSLRSCGAPGLDRGFDCASFGAGMCVSEQDAGRCAPLSDTPCTEPFAERCEGEVAVRCSGGKSERIDCKKLGLACAIGAPRIVGSDLSEACTGLAVSCTPKCDGSAVSSCFRNGTYRVDCLGLGLGACDDRGAADPHCIPP